MWTLLFDYHEGRTPAVAGLSFCPSTQQVAVRAVRSQFVIENRPDVGYRFTARARFTPRWR
jgi:hypothetical protein